VLIGVVLSACFAAMTACGSSAPPAGQSQAQAACLAFGAQAAQDAQQAASLNSKYATLSVDEAASAASQGQTSSELSDGNPSDDSGLGALAGTTSLGTGGGIKVISDCVSLGLSVTHH
jgi:hypothetical protein